MLTSKRSFLSFPSINFYFLPLLFLFAAPANIIAQTPQVQPLARLLSWPPDAKASSRPRRVSESATSAATYPSLNDATEIERRAFAMTNSVRLQHGLPPLEWDPELCRMGRAHSENMVRLGFFAHETPDGLHMTDRARAAGIRHWRVIAENIAYNQGFDDPGAFAVERWMLSPGHRSNILLREFERSAIGSFVAPDGTVYITQEFIAR
jgi:uncharacterized protein YkwD